MALIASSTTHEDRLNPVVSQHMYSSDTSESSSQFTESSSTSIITRNDGKIKSVTTADFLFSTRPATLADAAAITDLGATIFATTFGFSIPPNDLETYLSEAYSVAAIEDDILSPTKYIVVAVDNTKSDGQVIGFAQLTENTSEPCVAHIPSLVELQRLYVHAGFQGLGIGKALVSEVERLAKEMEYRNMWLGVWEGNFAAQKAYEKMGFKRVGEHEFSMGKCIQIDWMMVKQI